MQPINQLLLTIAKILEEILQETDPLSLQQASPFHTQRTPSISIENYIQRIAKYAHCNSVCFVFALIYLDKIQEMHQNVVLNSNCIHRFMIVSIMVAIKYYDDEYYKNEYYAKVGGLSLKEINQLEKEFLNMLNYELFIQKEVFEVYEERLKQYEVIEI
ncbi:unnamed protein product (macronuclear) [Paramecium tetraurelia]|uniref:Cyclin n=1 Tax=Paramecium tetraurelia TaxID=5888 RepID=A0DRR6_PARTE|nr:uncharacterized protein GSPATT00019451001 [Paramecium tetraurelia]CAK85733.1 unnamed protein product [Paramecium tetraurelia]|eukprot:XP_001453130.1 hypothetical protein (macronuclear) [Paramecium tetraurelia strain d4-2]